MSYVPPHLRSSITTTTSTKTLDSNGDHKLNSHHLSHSNDNNYNSSSALSNAARRSSDNLLSTPDPIVPLWNPSDRVLRLKPEQVAVATTKLVDYGYEPNEVLIDKMVNDDTAIDENAAMTKLPLVKLPSYIVLGCSGVWTYLSDALGSLILSIEEVRLRLNVDVIIPADSSPAPAPIESFTDMCLDSRVMKDIAFHEYTTPTSIQAQAMPVALSGRDLLGCAETGSGKTAAFTIPMIQHCLAQAPVRHGDGPLALVLAPTRELAQQIANEVKAFSRSLESFRTAIVVGGTNIAEQRSELRAGVNVVVATPGRFIDHLQQGNTSLSRISYVVLDEADRMLDMGFEPQIREVMRNLPKKHQTLLFSATMPVEIEALAQEYLTNPVQVKVGKVSSPTANVSQVLEKVPENEKIDRLLALLVEEATQAERSAHPFPLTIVFVERKTRCDEVAEALVAQGLHAVALHGGRTQSEREAALHDFRRGPTSILVATDVASRGLDVTGVAHVVNLDIPKTMEDYVHRIGRTGRAGSTGRASSFYTDRDMFLVAQIRKAISDVQSGNTVAFATGKVARRKEREAAAAQKEVRTALSKQPLMGQMSINVEDKYKYMIAPTMAKKEGSADDAWDD